MRSVLFHMFFYSVTFIAAIIAVIFTAIPGRKMVMITLQAYTKLICWGMGTIAGINVIVKGKENIPNGMCIIASKHQSYGDGHVISRRAPFTNRDASSVPQRCLAPL